MVAVPGELELGDDDAGDAADGADREVDLADQEDEDDADGDAVVPAICTIRLMKLTGAEEDAFLQVKKSATRMIPRITGRLPRRRRP